MSGRLVLTNAGHPSRLYRTAVPLAVALLTSSCVLGNDLSCNNRDVRASIAEAAVEAIASTLKMSEMSKDREDTARDYTLHDTFETAREGDVLSCQGTLGMTTKNKPIPDVPLDYQVMKTNDGNVLYTFDKERFGPVIIGLMMLKGMADQGKAAEQHEGSSASTVSKPRPLPYAADPNWSQFPK